VNVVTEVAETVAATVAATVARCENTDFNAVNYDCVNAIIRQSPQWWRSG